MTLLITAPNSTGRNSLTYQPDQHNGNPIHTQPDGPSTTVSQKSKVECTEIYSNIGNFLVEGI